MAGASSALQTKRELGKATRDAFGRALEALGGDHPNIVVVDADVSNSTRTDWFGKKYPDRFFNIGIAESNLVGIAGGLDGAGKTPVIASFAPFTIGKANLLREGKDVTLVAIGLMVAPALDAAEALAGSGVQARVLDMHTVKPIDRDALLAAARDTGALVVAEEHLAHGGLGSV